MGWFKDQFFFVKYASFAIDYQRMIGNISSEVSGDLYMIRVNGVVIGLMIRIILRLVRVTIEGIGEV